MYNLFEAKQRGELYHFTDIFGLIGMLSSGKMYAGFQRDWEVDNGYYFSFTRNHLMYKTTGSTKTASMFALANFVVDGDLISENLKIVPFQSRKNKSVHKVELEERVYSKINTLDLNKFCKYVVIDMSRFNLDNLLFRGATTSIRDKFDPSLEESSLKFYLYLCNKFDIKESENVIEYLYKNAESGEESFIDDVKFMINYFNQKDLELHFTEFPQVRNSGLLF